MARALGRRCAGALAALALGLSAAPAAADALLVFAAASLKDGLDAAIAEYDASGGREVRASYASSSTLARQIEQGAPADVFVSANPQWMDYLEQRGLIRSETRADLLGNELVLIAPHDSDLDLDLTAGVDLSGVLDGGHLAMGDPDHVPAGIYGKAALQGLGAWEAVAPQVARADNVRAALALVSRGEAPLGVVYASDAAADDGVRVVDTFPDGSHPPIIYPIAITTGSGHPDAAAFVDFLKSRRAAPLFERFGFTVPQ